MIHVDTNGKRLLVNATRDQVTQNVEKRKSNYLLTLIKKISKRRVLMGKIDVEILEALAQAMAISVQEFDASIGTEKKHICWVKMNFIKHFTEDVFFLNDYSEDKSFSQRNGNLIIRNMLEQLIEFLYLLKNPHHAEEYLGLTINFEEFERKQSLVKKQELLGEKRYNKDGIIRPSVVEMANDIGEKSSNHENLTLYKMYQILSEQCHNSYFSSLLDDVHNVHNSIPNSGLNENQISIIHIMSAITLTEFI